MTNANEQEQNYIGTFVKSEGSQRKKIYKEALRDSFASYAAGLLDDLDGCYLPLVSYMYYWLPPVREWGQRGLHNVSSQKHRFNQHYKDAAVTAAEKILRALRKAEDKEGHLSVNRMMQIMHRRRTLAGADMLRAVRDWRKYESANPVKGVDENGEQTLVTNPLHEAAMQKRQSNAMCSVSGCRVPAILHTGDRLVDGLYHRTLGAAQLEIEATKYALYRLDKTMPDTLTLREERILAMLAAHECSDDYDCETFGSVAHSLGVKIGTLHTIVSRMYDKAEKYTSQRRVKYAERWASHDAKHEATSSAYERPAQAELDEMQSVYDGHHAKTVPVSDRMKLVFAHARMTDEEKGSQTFDEASARGVALGHGAARWIYQGMKELAA